MLLFLIAISTAQIVANGDQYYQHLNGQCKMRFPPHRDGYCFRSSSCPGAVISSLCPNHDSAMGCCILEYSPTYGQVSSNITLEMFNAIFNDTIRSNAQFIHFLRSLDEAKVTSCHQQSAYLTQIAYDTKFLSEMEEIPKNLHLKTKKQLKFIGRGAIHVAGEKFYRWLFSRIRKPIIERPEMLTFPSLSYQSAAIIWSHSYSVTNNGPLYNVSFNELADGSKYGIMLQSYLLRGHLVETERLLSIWRNVNKALNCDCGTTQGPTCRVNGKKGHCTIVGDCKGKQAEAFDDCRSPANIAQCCLGFYGPIRINTFLEQDILQRFSVASAVMKVLKETTSSSDSSLTIKTFTDTATTFLTSRPSSKKAIALRESLENTKERKSKGKVTSYRKSIGGFQRETVVVITEYRKSEADKLQLWTSGPKWSPSVLVLQVLNNDTIIGVDGVTMQRFEVKAKDLGDSLKEKFYTGPWLLPVNAGMKVDLGAHETISLAIPHVEQSEMSLLISVESSKGAVSIKGVQSKRQFDVSWIRGCHNRETNNSTDQTHERLKRRKVAVLYSSSTSKSANATETLDTIVLSAKTLIMVRGITGSNVATVSASLTHVNRKSASLKGRKESVFIVTSHLTIVLSCFVVLFLIRMFVLHPQPTVDEGGEIHTYNDDLSWSGAANFHTYFPSAEPGEFYSRPRSVDSSFAAKSTEDSTCENMNTRKDYQPVANFFKLACILMFNLLIACETFISYSKLSFWAIKAAQRFFSTVTYLWVITETLVSSEGREISCPCTQGRSLFHSMIWGIPAALGVVQYVLTITFNTTWNWFSINAYVESCSTGLLFLAAISLWTANFIMALMHRIDGTQVCAWLMQIFLNVLFTTVWGLATFSDRLERSSWYQVARITINFTLATFVCASVCLYTTKTGVTNSPKSSRVAEANKNDV